LNFINAVNNIVHINHPKYTLLKHNLEKEQIINEAKQKEESYINAFNEVRYGNAKITYNDWLDPVSPLIYNESIKLIKLDDLAFIKEKNDCCIYTFKNDKGIAKKLTILKAYPGLKEEINRIIVGV